MKNLLFLTLLFSIFSTGILAKQIDENTAKLIGQNFLLNAGTSLRTNVNLELAYLANSGILSLTESPTPSTYFYIFNIGNDGYVIVSGDDIVTPVLGYSDESIFDPNNIPPNTAKWLEEYKSQIRDAIEYNIQATDEIATSWQNLTLGNSLNSSSRNMGSISPLMTTKWNQSPFYNAYCPSSSVTGCVATAMAQIMKYWNYPVTGSGFHSYNHETYGTLSANFGSTSYQWSSMPNSVNSANSAVATLMYHCGVSVDMNYSPQSSGAYVISSASPIQNCAEYALETYFGYNNTIQGVQRSNYTQSQWLNLLKTELEASRPVLYAGFGSGGGHCFVADGYDNNDFIHFNWGWGGAYDGYFQINALNPSGIGIGGGAGGYNTGHQAVVGIQPPGGGTPQNYDLRLYSDINMPSTYIWFTDQFSLNVNIANYGTGNFSGDYGAAIFDKNYNFVDFLEIKTGMNLNANFHYTSPLNFTTSSNTTFVPGIYYVALYYKTPTQNWTIIGNGSYNNWKQFQIYYNSSIETNSNFSITTNSGKLINGQSSTVNVDIINKSSNTFYGQFRVNLSNLDRSWAQNIQILNENNGLPFNYHYTNGVNFTGTITVPPGTYLLEVAYKAQGSSTWYYAGSSNYTNPIYVIVEAPALSPDQYENNNNISLAYTLPLSFSGSTAIKNTVGANIHIATDNDFYKINLPSGFKYTITPRLHDSYNSGNGNIYTVDALFSYSTDGVNWSQTYDDLMTGNIVLQNGGTLYFHTAPYFAGEKGTYLLDMSVNRTAVTGIRENIIANEIITYPNPSKGQITIDLEKYSGKVSRIDLLNLQGQITSSYPVVSNKDKVQLNLSDQPAGTYLLQIQSTDGMLVKKVIIEK